MAQKSVAKRQIKARAGTRMPAKSFWSAAISGFVCGALIYTTILSLTSHRPAIVEYAPEEPETPIAKPPANREPIEALPPQSTDSQPPAAAETPQSKSDAPDGSQPETAPELPDSATPPPAESNNDQTEMPPTAPDIKAPGSAPPQSFDSSATPGSYASPTQRSYQPPVPGQPNAQPDREPAPEQ